MKKILSLTVSLCMSTIYLFGQPVIQSSNFPTSYSTSYYSFNTTLNEGMEGQNQTWNFSALSTNFDHEMNIIPVNTGVLNESFPQADYCYKVFTDTQTIYAYYNLNPNGFEILGAVSNGTIQTDYNNNTFRVFQFPYQYNSIITDTFHNNVNNLDGSCTITYDAWGTLITPFGTYNDVIRQKQLYDDGEISYTWYNTNPVYEIMYLYPEYNYGQVIDQAKLNNENYVNNEFSIFPNPTNGPLYITSKTKLKKINISNFEGKLIREIQSNNISEINIQELLKGVYILQLIGENNEVLSIEMIIKE